MTHMFVVYETHFLLDLNVGVSAHSLLYINESLFFQSEPNFLLNTYGHCYKLMLIYFAMLASTSVLVYV